MKFFMKLRKSGWLKPLIIGLTVCFLIIPFTGCDDTDSYEAQLEEARMAIDDGNYTLARSILEGLPQTIDVLMYLSHAIAGGELNLDTFNIISTLEDLGDSGNSGSIDMIGLIIGNDSNQLSSTEIDSKLASATEAIELFKDIAALQGKTMEELSDDHKLQIGLLSITRTVLSIADMISDELPGEDVGLTESWIQDNRDGFTPINPDSEDLNRVDEDLTYISNAIGVFADTNDMKDDYQGFRDELDPNGDNQTSSTELNNYIDNM